jgi:hypothetical protein
MRGSFSPLTKEDVPSLRRLVDYLERLDKVISRVIATQIRRIIFAIEDGEIS